MGGTDVTKYIDFLPSWSTTESEKFAGLSELIFSVISSMPQDRCYKPLPDTKSQSKEFIMHLEQEMWNGLKTVGILQELDLASPLAPDRYLFYYLIPRLSEVCE